MSSTVLQVVSASAAVTPTPAQFVSSVTVLLLHDIATARFLVDAVPASRFGGLLDIRNKLLFSG